MRIRPRLDWPWLVSALVVLVTGTVVTVVNTRDDGLVSPVGRFESSRYEMDAKVASSTVTLPIGVLTVGVTEPLEEVADSPDLRERRPPEDGSFVGVTTRLQQTFATPSVADATEHLATTPIEVVVVADGRRYPVRSRDTARSTESLFVAAQLRGYLAVAGNPRDVTVEVGFDGQRQTVNPRTGQRDAGRFAELPKTPATFTERDCPAAVLPTGYRTTEFGGPPGCIVENSVRVPWVAGLGWAPTGQSWQAVAVFLDRTLELESTATGAGYASTSYGNPTTMTLAGQRTRGSLTGNEAPPERRTGTLTGLFLVPRGSGPAPVELSTRFPHMVRDSDAPASAPLDPSLVVSWKVSVS